MTHYPFSDLHSFKDYVGFVQMCAADEFPEREGVGPNEQWTLDLAFDGLRVGLELAAKERGPLPAFISCQRLVEEAYSCFNNGRIREGFSKLEEVRKMLRTIPSQ